MRHDIDFNEAAVYVGTYAKYNNGSIEGKWLRLSDYDSREEFYDACAELHCDEEDPEYMFQDYENIPESLISESWMSSNLFEVRDAIGELDETERIPFFLWCHNDHYDLSKEGIEKLIATFHDDYMGQYESEEDFARELVEERGDLSEFALLYFDYDAYAKDLFMGDYWTDDGYVFCKS